jgi:hypothetical protein
VGWVVLVVVAVVGGAVVAMLVGDVGAGDTGGALMSSLPLSPPHAAAVPATKSAATTQSARTVTLSCYFSAF